VIRYLLFFILTAEAIATGLLPMARGHLFTLLAVKEGAIWFAILLYFLNYTAVEFAQCFKAYVVLKLALFYRSLRTNSVIDKIDHRHSNLPQRIQEDIKLSYLQRITVYSEYYVSTLILIQLVLLNLTIPLLILSALLYAGLSVLAATLFNPRLTRAEIISQQSEASFRTSLVENLSDISLLPETNKLVLKSNWLQTEYLLFTKLQLGLVVVLPYIVLLPQYLNGTIDLGILVANQASFSLLVVNAAILIAMYPKYIQGKASEHRVKEVMKK